MLLGCAYIEVLTLTVTVMQGVIVLDIEGTTTPISFVTEVLFPYAKENAGAFLRSTYESKETQSDIQLLREQVNITLEVISHRYTS